jgi:hypothetical protein
MPDAVRYVWLHCRMRFREVDWDELRPGDTVYYYVPRPRQRGQAYGPFVVADPARCRLRNHNGVEMSLPRVQPVLLDEKTR